MEMFSYIEDLAGIMITDTGLR